LKGEGGTKRRNERDSAKRETGKPVVVVVVVVVALGDCW
jgi:hypothetical protein